MLIKRHFYLERIRQVTVFTKLITWLMSATSASIIWREKENTTMLIGGISTPSPEDSNNNFWMRESTRFKWTGWMTGVSYIITTRNYYSLIFLQLLKSCVSWINDRNKFSYYKTLAINIFITDTVSRGTAVHSWIQSARWYFTRYKLKDYFVHYVFQKRK